MFKFRIQTWIKDKPYSVNELVIESDKPLTEEDINNAVKQHALQQSLLDGEAAAEVTIQKTAEWKLKEEEHNKALKTLALLTLIVNALKKEFGEDKVDKLIQDIKGSPAFLKEQNRHD